jgi:hypothetical protein
MPTLVHRCGNLNTRIHESSLQSLLSIAACDGFGCGYIFPFAISELPKRGRDASQAAQMYGRLDLLHNLLSTYHSTKELSVNDVLQFSKQGLEMADDKVRQTAIKVIVEVHKIEKAAGRNLQLEERLGNLKPALMQMLQKRCEEADNGNEAEGAAPGASSADSRTLPAIGSMKVLGKALPPIGAAPSFGPGRLAPLKKHDPFASASAVVAPNRSASQRTRMAGGDASSSSVPTSDLAVPKYSQMVMSPSSKAKALKQMPASQAGAGVMDAAEENIIQYLMQDQR